MPTTSVFPSLEVARLAGVPYQTLDRWVADGIVTCEIPAQGTGTRRLFTYRDIVLVIVARTLKDLNLPMPAVRNILAGIRSGWDDDDPAHAGYVVLQSGVETAAATWLDEPVGLNAFLTAARTRSSLPDAWTGVIILIDVTFLARGALAQIDAALAGHKPPSPKARRSSRRSGSAYTVVIKGDHIIIPQPAPRRHSQDED